MKKRDVPGQPVPEPNPYRRPWETLQPELRQRWMTAACEWVADALIDGSLWTIFDRIGDPELTAAIEKAVPSAMDGRVAGILLPRLYLEISCGRIDARDPALRPVAPLALAMAWDPVAMRDVEQFAKNLGAHVYSIGGPMARALTSHYGGDPCRCEVRETKHLEIGSWYWGLSREIPAAVWTGTEFVSIEVRGDPRHAWYPIRSRARFLPYHTGQHEHGFSPFYLYSWTDWFHISSEPEPIPADKVSEGWYAGRHWVAYYWNNRFWSMGSSVQAAWSLPTDDASRIAVPSWYPVNIGNAENAKPLLRLPAPQIAEPDPKFPSVFAKAVRYPFPAWPLPKKGAKEARPDEGGPDGGEN